MKSSIRLTETLSMDMERAVRVVQEVIASLDHAGFVARLRETAGPK